MPRSCTLSRASASACHTRTITRLSWGLYLSAFSTRLVRTFKALHIYLGQDGLWRDLKLDSLAARECSVADSLLHERAQIGCRARADQARVLEARHVEQPNDQVSESLTLLDQTIQPDSIGRGGWVALVASKQELSLSDDPGQRRFQIVGRR